MITSRRSLITGMIAFIGAPAIVRAGSLMPVKAIKPEWAGITWDNYGRIEQTIWLIRDYVYVSDRDGKTDIYAWGVNGIGEQLTPDR